MMIICSPLVLIHLVYRYLGVLQRAASQEEKYWVRVRGCGKPGQKVKVVMPQLSPCVNHSSLFLYDKPRNTFYPVGVGGMESYVCLIHSLLTLIELFYAVYY